MSSSHETPSSADLETTLRSPGVAGSLDQSVERAADLPRALATFEILCQASDDHQWLARLEADSRFHDALWTILGGAPTFGETLTSHPELLELVTKEDWLEHPRTPEQARAACRDFCFAREERGAALKNWRQRELLRIALRDLVLNAPSSETTLEIALLASACLDLAFDEIRSQLRSDARSSVLTVVGLGDLGGLEMHLSSDLDVAFVFASSSPEQNALASRFAQELTAFLKGATDDNAGWNMNVGLRPRDALLFSTQTLHDYLNDPRSGFGVSQRQSLTRARFAAGDSALGAKTTTSMRGAAHPPGWDFDWNDELLGIKDQAERQHAQQSSSDTFDVKFDTGTLSDIEWTAQWLALKHGHDVPTLQISNTRAQLQAARGANLLAGVEFNALIGAYDWFRRAQLRLQIARGGALSSVQRDSNDFEIWARAVLPTQPKEEASVVFEETWRVHAQNVRMIFERVRDML